MIYFDDFGNELKLCRPIQVSKNRRINPNNLKCLSRSHICIDQEDDKRFFGSKSI